jgi:virginiamycin B lyase
MVLPLLAIVCIGLFQPAASLAGAPGTGQISGTVTAEQGEVAGFLVKARNARAGMTYNVFTRSGKYRFPGLKPARYEVWVAQRGFDSPVREMELAAGAAVQADIHVEPEAGFDVAEQFRPRDPHTNRIREDAERVAFDDLYPPGPGRDALVKHCFNCHGTWFHHMRNSPEGWAFMVKNMVDRRSIPNHRQRNIIYTKENFPDGDAELITAYLSEHFGPDDSYRDLKLDELRPNEDVVAEAIYIEYDVPAPEGWRPRSYHDPYIAPDGGVWFNDRANRSLLRIDPDAESAADRVAEEHQAPWPNTSMHGITIDRKGRVYYADIAGGFLGELNPATGEFKRHSTTGDPDESMVQIVVDSKDNVWMGLISGNKLGKLDAATREVTLWDWPTPDTNPYGLIAARDDTIYTAGISKHMIVRFDPGTETFTEYPTPAQPSAPRRLGEDEHGNIWWAEYTGGHIGVLDPRTGTMRAFAFPLAHSRGYDCWPVGKYIWVTEATYETLVRFEPGSVEFVYYPLPLSQPSGNPGVPKIEVEPDGTIWFAYRGLRDRSNPVVAFKPWGNAEK